MQEAFWFAAFCMSRLVSFFLMSDLYNVLLATAFSLLFASLFVSVACRMLSWRCF